jgi:hypothetical protein
LAGASAPAVVPDGRARPDLRGGRARPLLPGDAGPPAGHGAGTLSFVPDDPTTVEAAGVA